MAGILLNRSRQIPAEDTPAFGGIAERFRRAGDLDRAITLCRDGLKRFPNLLSARVTLGWALLDKGDYDEARIELEQVMRRAPDNLAAIRGLAELHDRTDGTVSSMESWPPHQDHQDHQKYQEPIVPEKPLRPELPSLPHPASHATVPPEPVANPFAAAADSLVPESLIVSPASAAIEAAGGAALVEDEASASTVEGLATSAGAALESVTGAMAFDPGLPAPAAHAASSETMTATDWETEAALADLGGSAAWEDEQPTTGALQMADAPDATDLSVTSQVPGSSSLDNAQALFDDAATGAEDETAGLDEMLRALVSEELADEDVPLIELPQAATASLASAMAALEVPECDDPELQAVIDEMAAAEVAANEHPQGEATAAVLESASVVSTSPLLPEPIVDDGVLDTPAVLVEESHTTANEILVAPENDAAPMALVEDQHALAADAAVVEEQSHEFAERAAAPESDEAVGLLQADAQPASVAEPDFDEFAAEAEEIPAEEACVESMEVPTPAAEDIVYEEAIAAHDIVDDDTAVAAAALATAGQPAPLTLPSTDQEEVVAAEVEVAAEPEPAIAAYEDFADFAKDRAVTSRPVEPSFGIADTLPVLDLIAAPAAPQPEWLNVAFRPVDDLVDLPLRHQASTYTLGSEPISRSDARVSRRHAQIVALEGLLAKVEARRLQLSTSSVA
ncbi:MAG: tetratricopeptide repeat protein [Vicinamibacterales bacterium]